MKKKTVQIFHIPLPEFYSTMKAKVSYMRRDKTEFAGEGVEEAQFDKIEQDLEVFNDLPTDDEMVGEEVIATQKKDELKAVLHDQISTILNKAANKYGTESGYYRKFGIGALSRLDGPELLTSARRVLRVGRSMLPALAANGLTEQMLTELADTIEKFDDAIALQEDTISDRDIASDERIEQSNAIYLLVAKLCDTGKRIWASKNEAKYNDYVLYDTPPSKPDNEQNKQ